MSYDDNHLKTRKSQIYFDSIYKEYKDHRNKKIASKNSHKSNKDLTKSHDIEKNPKKVIVYRRAQKQLTIAHLSSTLESTISSSKAKNDDENSTISSEFRKKVAINSKKIVQAVDEDMKFIFDIFFKKNQYNNQAYYNIRKSTKNNYKSRISREDIDYQNKYYNYNNEYNLNAVKNYLIKIQKKYNLSWNLMFYKKIYQNNMKISGNLMDHYHLQKIEDLIARYSLIIFVFLKSGKIKQAKEIFLLMLKENKDILNNIEKKICIKYMVLNRRINIYKDIPKITYQLAKIYSFIIKYSQLFNLSNYRNIFMDKYFQIQHLNYNFYMIKGSARGFSAETINQIKYWLSYCLHNSFYYTIYNYFPLRIPIILNYNILNLYNNLDETILTDSEKSLLIKTSYNQGIIYYLNGQNDEALTNLNQAKKKIKSFSDDYYIANNINLKNSKHFNLKKHLKENYLDIKEISKIRKKSTINPFKVKFIEDENKNIKIINKKNTNKTPNFKDANGLDINNLSIISENNKNQGESSPKSKSEEMKEEILKGFKKEKITIKDIELLLDFGKEKGILNEEPTSDFKGLDFLFKYKESFSAIRKKITLPKGFRGSHISFHTSMKIKDFSIPERYKNPLLRKIELLMCLIELDKKNYEASFEHALKVLYIIILLKISNNNYYQNDFFNKQKTEIYEYFQLIEDTYDMDYKKKQLLEKYSSRSMLTINDRLSINSKNTFNKFNLNNSINNLNYSNIFFDNNKAVENNFYHNGISSGEINFNNDNNNNTQNYSNFSYDQKIVKEFEKFFIFLHNLSIYQIKILNETQPENDKRNNLPIMFSNQFKDCLSRIQRRELDNLQTMALSRFIVLKDPDKWIFPSNLNYLIIKKNKDEIINQKNSPSLNFERYKYMDETLMKTKEYKNYLNIINSEKSNPEIKDFLKRNKNYVLKILKKSSDKEISNMIEYPYIIIEPIKKHKKNMKKRSRNINSVDFNCTSKRPKTITNAFARQKIKKHEDKNDCTIFNRKTQNYKRNNNYTDDSSEKSIYNGNCKYNERHCTVENYYHHKRKHKYNDSSESFEDYTLSPECSSKSNYEQNE